MKFIITRASKDHYVLKPSEQPVQGATLESFEYIDHEGVAKTGQVWMIEIHSLDELLALDESIIIEQSDVQFRNYGLNFPHITIYDGYVE